MPYVRDIPTDRILSDSVLFHGLEAAGAADVVRELPVAELAAGHVFFSPGDTIDTVHIILAGKVKVGCGSSDGREVLLTVLGPSDAIGESSVFDSEPTELSATAITDVSAAVSTGQALRVWATEYPAVADRMLRILARQIRRADRQLHAMAANDVPGRLAAELLRLAQQFGVQADGSMRVTHDLTQDELAQLVGATRESVNKTLSEFCARGWVVLDDKAVLIVDADRLARRARMLQGEPQVAADSSVRAATALIAQRFGLSSARATLLLDKLSRESRRPVAVVAAEIVERGTGGVVLPG